MMLIPSFVAPSDIEGVGVFAAEDIKAGKIIWRLETTFDRLIDSVHLTALPPHMQEFMTRYAYPLHNDPETLVLEADNGHFMNHSVRPNTDFTEITAGYAIRDIAKGEELLCNYFEFDPSHELLPSMQSILMDEDCMYL